MYVCIISFNPHLELGSTGTDPSSECPGFISGQSVYGTHLSRSEEVQTVKGFFSDYSGEMVLSKPQGNLSSEMESVS